MWPQDKRDTHDLLWKLGMFYRQGLTNRLKQGGKLQISIHKATRGDFPECTTISEC
jgi:hypothetical protein